jgi:hypothetical protein
MSEVAMKIPFSQRINLRIVVFAAVVLGLVGYPAYIYLETELTGGIRKLGDYTKVDLKAMSTFAFDKIAGRLEDVPRQWRDLDGKKVIVEGEMWAPTAAGPTTDRFDLCYSISNCCFTGPPQVQHFVKARPVNGPVPNMHYSRVRVTGVLRVKIEREEGQITSVYQLDVDTIEPVT